MFHVEHFKAGYRNPERTRVEKPYRLVKLLAGTMCWIIHFTRPAENGSATVIGLGLSTRPLRLLYSTVSIGFLHRKRIWKMANLPNLSACEKNLNYIEPDFDERIVNRF